MSRVMFTAVVSSMKQGDHSCINLWFTGENGVQRRVGTVIMPDDVVKDFLRLFVREPLDRDRWSWFDLFRRTKREKRWTSNR